MSYGFSRLFRHAVVVGGVSTLIGVAAPTAGATMDQSSCELPPERDLAVSTEMHQAGSQADDKVLLSSFEVGWVVSHMNSLDCEEGVGVFKLKPGSQWCDDAAQCKDVEHVTTQFLDRASDAYAENPDYSAGEIAAEVMGSAYPDRYDGAEDKAQSLIEEAKNQS